ncbi:transglycosylase domain-containing protein [Patescibacteria group bacterium]
MIYKTMFLKIVKKLLVIFILGALIALAIAMIIFGSINIPDVSTLEGVEIIQSTKIYDRTGEVLLWEIHGEEKRTIVPFEEISRHVKNATVAIEDSYFYSHKGISFIGILRAFIADILSGEIEQGGSTITQQFVKNALLTPEKTIIRKIKEVVIATKLERLYTKDEILSLYLNEIPYGSNAYGIESAAQTFFGKSNGEVSLAEAAYLAALPQASSYYSPYGNHKDELGKRKNLVLSRMRELGFITEEESETAKKEQVAFLPRSKTGIIAPHFVMYVTEMLAREFGEQYMERAGLKITTTLDAELQEKAEEIVSRYAESNKEKFNASNAGLIAIDPKTGEILTMVGSHDYFDIEGEGNFNITLAHRQPGSAFKPIVYAAAFQKGYTPDTVVFDLETNFTSEAAVAEGADKYMPKNYDNKFRGPITLRDALAQSVNVPSVKVLYLTGLKESLNLARNLGITSLAGPLRYGLTLVLGGGEVSLLELTSAYGVFANKGTRVQPSAIKKIESNSGKNLFEYEIYEKRVIEEDIANAINDILADNEARAPAFGWNSPLFFEGYDVAVKTGTTNDYRDAWTLGYSPTIAVGAWAGNNDNSPMEKKIAGFIITPLWHEFMETALIKMGNESFLDPPDYDVEKLILKGEWRGNETYTIDTVSGKLATEFTPPEKREDIVIKDIHCILFSVNKSAPRGPVPENPENDPQFNNWESVVRQWVKENNIIEDDPENIPDEFDDIHTQDTIPEITLLKPLEENYKKGDIIEIKPRIKSTHPISQIDIFFNDEFVRSQRNNFSTIFIDTNLFDVITNNKNSILLKIYDSMGNKNSVNFFIEIE